MTSAPSFYWFDYETFGADPRCDRPSQFAGVRTDWQLNPIGEPLVIYNQLSPDYVPNPDACLVTGITPQTCLREGLPETEFIGRINDAFAQAQTCAVGYNSIRFDDEVTRHTLYRNLYDPYAREWQNGNSRWDLIDVVRMTYALRPDGIEWPRREEDGVVTFRLELLTKANGISHESAHDALSDVWATIALAKLIRDKQPKLYDYALGLRQKRQVQDFLHKHAGKPFLHVSSKIPAQRSCLGIYMVIGPHPTNSNGVIAVDLGTDPETYLDLTAEQIAERTFSTNAELAEKNMTRVGIKTIHVNKCPMLMPMNVLREQDRERLGIDLTPIDSRASRVQSRGADFLRKVQQALTSSVFPEEKNPDFMLYSGGFFSEADRARMNQIHRAPPNSLHQDNFVFDDKRLAELLFRYRARNYPGTLDEEDMKRWQLLVREQTQDSWPAHQQRVHEPAFKQSFIEKWSATRYDELIEFYDAHRIGEESATKESRVL